MFTVIAFIGFVISPLFRKMGTMHETLNLQEIKKNKLPRNLCSLLQMNYLSCPLGTVLLW